MRRQRNRHACGWEQCVKRLAIVSGAMDALVVEMYVHANALDRHEDEYMRLHIVAKACNTVMLDGRRCSEVGIYSRDMLALSIY